MNSGPIPPALILIGELAQEKVAISDVPPEVLTQAITETKMEIDNAEKAVARMKRMLLTVCVMQQGTAH